MSGIDTSKADLSEITICGLKFVVPAPFKEGHVMRANEASVLNQTYAENLRNNFAGSVKAAMEDKDGNKLTPDEKALQSALDTYVASYDFGVRKAGGGVRVSLDPIEKEARAIASIKVKEALRKKGVNIKDMDKEQFAALVTGALEKYPQIREVAKQRVEQMKAIATA